MDVIISYLIEKNNKFQKNLIEITFNNTHEVEANRSGKGKSRKGKSRNRQSGKRERWEGKSVRKE